jgi:hypothetical protein
LTVDLLAGNAHPPSPAKVCKVFETGWIGLDFEMAESGTGERNRLGWFFEVLFLPGGFVKYPAAVSADEQRNRSRLIVTLVQG